MNLICDVISTSGHFYEDLEPLNAIVSELEERFEIAGIHFSTKEIDSLRNHLQSLADCSWARQAMRESMEVIEEGF